jgi:hypothetical protein
MSSEEEYRRLATEVRARALQTVDPYAKRVLLLVGQRYDELAARARRMEQAPKLNKSA